MPTIYKESGIEKINKNDGLRMAIGFIIATLIGVFSVLAYVFNWFSFEEAFANPNQNWWVYIVIIVIGFVAAAACIIPGISGAMILFIFGLYQPVLNIYFLYFYFSKFTLKTNSILQHFLLPSLQSVS